MTNSPLPLHASMISLGVTDMARSIGFYRDTLGLALVSGAEPDQIAILQSGEIRIVLNRPLAQTATHLAGAVEVIFAVESVDTAYRLLAAKGCAFLRPPREVFSGTWAATFPDPDGHLLTILGQP